LPGSVAPSYDFLAYGAVGMRTNVDLDDRLVSEVMHRYRLKTKREAVDLALRRLLEEPLDPAQALTLEGSGWDADLAELRESRRAVS
jgi:Arc/MetJ family transcription regulator